MLKRAVRQRMSSGMPCKIVLGGAGIFQQGWIPTDIESLNILKPGDWKRYFQEGSVDAMMAEHVWEHLTREQGVIAAKLCFRYLRPGGYLRIAVPDGFHPDPQYIEQVKVGGLDTQGLPLTSGPDAIEHKILYTYWTLTEIFELAGYNVDLLEYFDEQGTFHFKEWHPSDGLIFRSKRFDGRNKTGVLAYTSIILDAWKKERSRS